MSSEKRYWVGLGPNATQKIRPAAFYPPKHRQNPLYCALCWSTWHRGIDRDHEEARAEHDRLFPAAFVPEEDVILIAAPEPEESGIVSEPTGFALVK